MHPLYVSTVDSGSLAGHLLTLAAGLREMPDEPILRRRFLPACATRPGARHLRERKLLLAELDADLARAPGTLAAARDALERALAWATQLALSLASAGVEPKRWAETLRQNCEEHRDELLWLAPWLEAGTPADAAIAEHFARLDRVPTLRELAEG